MKEASFGAVMFAKERWVGAVRYYRSDNPDDIKSYHEGFVCIGSKYRSANDAMRAVDKAARYIAGRLIKAADPRVIVLIPHGVFAKLAPGFDQQTWQKQFRPEPPKSSASTPKRRNFNTIKEFLATA